MLLWINEIPEQKEVFFWARYFRKMIAKGWSVDTRYAHHSYVDNDPPSAGQCAVSAILLQRVLGGELIRCVVQNQVHYLNYISDKYFVDITGDQFGDAGVIVSTEFPWGIPAYIRKAITDPRTLTRADLLKHRSEMYKFIPTEIK